MTDSGVSGPSMPSPSTAVRPVRDYSGYTVLVTGGTSGLGAAIAMDFIHSGATVVAAGLNPGRAPQPLAASGAAVVELDVRHGGAVTELISSFDRLDILVNAAGTIRRGQEFELDTFLDVLDINLSGAMRCCVEAYPLLAQRAGCIVNIASMLSFFGGPLVPAYTASKGGIAQLTKSLAVAWAEHGIRVNAVAPGWIVTDLTAELRQDTVAEAKILGRTPMRRWGRSEEVASAVSFLSSRAEAGFITGAILTVDGGYSAS